MCQPHGRVSFKAYLIAITGHDGLTGNLRQDITTLIIRAEGP